MGSQRESVSYNKQLVALELALQDLREEETEEGLIRVTLEYLKSDLQYAVAWLGRYDRSSHQLVGKGGNCSTGGDPSFFKQRFTVAPGNLLEQVLAQQHPLGIPNLQEESRGGEWSIAARKFNIQGTVFFPIRYKNTCLGIVLLGSALWGTSPHAEEKTRLSMILGELAKSLYLLEADQQRQQLKRLDEPLLNLLPKLRSLPNLQRQLEAIVDETHRFMMPHRTSIYWYEPKGRYFWKRLGNRGIGFMAREGKPSEEISVQEVTSFYYAMGADQLVSIEDAANLLQANQTGRLTQMIQARSLIAAPIIYQGELLGFLSVEGNKVQTWTEEEKNFVRGAAHLVGLTAPLDQTEKAIQQVKLDQGLTTEVSRALHSEEDWQSSLKKCTEQLCQRFKIERFLVLLYNKDLKKFEIVYQNQLPGKRRPLPTVLERLAPVDWQMLERSLEAIAIENLDDDLKLVAWRKTFLDLGMRSLLVCNTSVGKPPEGLIVIGDDATRSWSHVERELFQTVSQQVGLLTHQIQLQRQTDQLQKNYQAVQWGLTTLRQTQDLERLEQVATQQIAKILQAPLVALLTWQPGRTSARVVAPVVNQQQQFGLIADLLIPTQTDSLIQAALQADGLISLGHDEISPETRYWLSGSEIGQVLALALRTDPDHEPTGIILVGDRQNRTWTDNQMNVLGILASQLAWCRRNLGLTSSLVVQKETLEQLNWYKQRRLEEVYRILGMGIRRLNELPSQPDTASNLRYPQILRYLGSTLSAMAPLLKHEQWQFHEHDASISLASLLKQALERVDVLFKQRQLWLQVHNEANLNLNGDIAKIEFIFHEILVLACARSPVGGRLDIWCRQKDANFLDLSVTDQGRLEPQLLEALQAGRSTDLLLPSLLDQLPGLHLTICQGLMQRIGGEFNLSTMEDNRSLSTLVIPLNSRMSMVKFTEIQT
ncbi:MAG: GAF domain-containing protein [Timaviella obliquedivisa GSE-PSE-MK23-08B]|jgi:GAF domain-containing protein|nr:GAF domain-containing protein [Timaviella obliquedivisa GSE-PSE-MK23-08B]